MPSRRQFAQLLVTATLPLVFTPRLFATSQPPLQLATHYRDGLDLSDYWVSEKFDGVRAYWDGRQLHSRNGHRYFAPGWFTADFPTTPLDGELWLGRRRFDEVSGLVRRQSVDSEAWREVRFIVFDLPDSPQQFEHRRAQLQQLLATSSSRYLQGVTHFQVATADALATRLSAIEQDGGEGLMLNHRRAHYRPGRSRHLLKLKSYQDAEARVIGHLPGKGKYRGQLGALLVETPAGVRFRLGSGFTDRERRQPPPLGSRVTYKFYGYTRHGLPRFASFLRLHRDL